MTLRGLKEYAQAEEVSAGFGVDSVSVSDLSCGIGVSKNGGVLGESSTYFCGTLRRFSTWQKIGLASALRVPDMCRHVTRRNIAQEFGFSHFCGSFLTLH